MQIKMTNIYKCRFNYAIIKKAVKELIFDCLNPIFKGATMKKHSKFLTLELYLKVRFFGCKIKVKFKR